MTGLTTCWWAARRLDRYLDADAAAPLSTTDAARLERHVATCRRCARELAGRRQLRERLHDHGRRRRADADALARLHAVAAAVRAGAGPA